MSEKVDLLNFDELNEDHKIAASEICSLAEQMGNFMLSELIKEKFLLKERNYFDLTKTNFYKTMNSNGVKVLLQGYIKEGIDYYPIVSVVDDIRKLDSISLKDS
jgi:hypothetical protein